MRIRSLYSVVFLLLSLMSFSQDSDFYVELSSDTVLAGNILQITFQVNNTKGEFEGPDLKGMKVISGPNMSSQMSIINGKVNQSASYNYGVFCEEIGELTILPAYLVTKEVTLETEPITILVLPNPEGIIEQPPSQSGIKTFGFPSQEEGMSKQSKKSKKKRKLKKL